MGPMLDSLRRLVASTRARAVAFREDVRGNVTIESLLVLPMYTYCFVFAFSFFDAFRLASINEKAAYTISDVISRRNPASPVDKTYIAGLNNVFDYLIENRGTTWIRVTSVTYDGLSDTYTAEWSWGTKGNSKLTTGSLTSLRNRLPVMSNGDNVVLIETFTTYQSSMNSLANRVMETFIFTRPRFAPRIGCSDC